MSRNYAKKTKSHKAAVVLIMFVVGIFYAVMHMAINAEQEQLNDRQEELNKVQNLIADEEDRTAKLEELKIRVQTYEYIEERARQLGLVYPNEIVFKPK